MADTDSLAALEPNEALRRIAELLKGAKGVAGTLAAGSTLSGQMLGQLMDMFLGKKPEMVEQAAYGFPPTQGTGMTLGPKQEFAGDIADLLPISDMASAVKGVASSLAATKGIPALAGILNWGGPKNLIMHHTRPLETLLKGGGLKSDIFSPSISITKNKLVPFGGSEGNVVMIPKPGAFDPAYSPSTLFNRDAYLARWGDYPLAYSSDPAERAAGRNIARFEAAPYMVRHTEAEGSQWLPPHLRGLERDPEWGWKPYAAISGHTAAIEASPAFRSFAEFTRSRKGAGVLGEKGDSAKWSKEWERSYQDWTESQVAKGGALGWDWMSNLREAAKGGDQAAASLIKRAQLAPSSYAELKVSGPVPLSSTRFAGVIGPTEDYAPRVASKVRDALYERGIPYVENPGMNYYDLMDLATQLQEAAGPVKERSLRQGALWTPTESAMPEPRFAARPSSPPPEAVVPPGSSLDAAQEAMLKTAEGGFVVGPSGKLKPAPVEPHPFSKLDIAQQYEHGLLQPHEAWAMLLHKAKQPPNSPSYSKMSDAEFDLLFKEGGLNPSVGGWSLSEVDPLDLKALTEYAKQFFPSSP